MAALQRGRLWGCLYLLALGCSGGSSGPGTGGSAVTGDLRVASHWPADGAVQVDPNAAVWITFDSALVAAAVHDDRIFVHSAAESAVEGSLSTRDSGRTVVFTPAQPLQPACDYTVAVMDDVCDTAGRLLAQPFRFQFRTYDAIPPQIATASIAAGQNDVDRSAPLVVQFDERLDPASVTTDTVLLRDRFGALVPLAIALYGTAVSIDPVPDLAGSAPYTLVLRGGAQGIHDVAGNALAADWQRPFTTAADTTAPTLRWSMPDTGATGRSPAIRPSFTFDESMDPASFELGGIDVRDEFNTQVAFTVTASPDQRTLRLNPLTTLAQNRLYSVTLRSGPSGVTDVSGNSLRQAAVVTFRTGTDVTAPVITGTTPADNATGVSPNFAVQVAFSEPMDPSSVGPDTVVLGTTSGAVPATYAWSADRATLTVLPAVPARPLTDFTLTVYAGVGGPRDAAGNPLVVGHTMQFTSNSDATVPTVSLSPGHGAIALPRNLRIVALFSPSVDPATVAADSITLVHRATGQPIPGTVSVGRGNRTLVFTPAAALPGNAAFDLTLRGGPGGPRCPSGNWLSDDVTARLQTGSGMDGTPPVASVSLNGIAAERQSGLCLPPSGFTIEVDAYDAGDGTLDLSTLDLWLSGPGSAPASDDLFAVANLSSTHASVQVPPQLALASGAWTLRAAVRDLSGNQSLIVERAFTVASATTDVLPFERSQVVWVRFDMDRDGRGRGDGTPDLDEDLLHFGLLSASDPIGRNALLRQVVIDAVLAQANRLFARNADGTPIPGSSVSVRLAARQPCSSTHMRIAFGGQDPEANRKRSYGEDSSGVLGRALFDYRNQNFTDNDSGTSPGLGVFPDEMFLYEGKIFRDLYPYYVTLFGRTYRPLSPYMGGTPAGEGPLDATVLSPQFVYAQATPSERLRYQQIFGAADDFATAMGTILAHEIGHSLGLTAEGLPPHGLHGDHSLHDDGADAGDVMSAYVSWDTLIAVEQRFRDIDLSYLRQRILCR